MDIGAWLRRLGLGQYEQPFRDHDIDAEVLPELTADDLSGLGVASIGHRRKLLAAIAALRKGTPFPEPRRLRPNPPRRPLAAFPPEVPEAERRQLTVMFVDLVGSTALSTRLDPEDMREILRAYQNTVTGEIARVDGHVAKLMGDGVLAYFGWPRAHEDEAERAVRAGLAITTAVGRLATPAGEPLAARVGIATGLVVVGDLVGEGAAQEEAVIGETPNLAARLQEAAAPGAVVVAEGTRRLLGEVFELHGLGPTPAQGLRRPGGRLPGPRRAPRRQPLRGPSVGSAAAHGRARPGVGARARALAAGRGRRGPGGASGRRGRDRQVAAGPGRARRVGARTITWRSATSARPITPAPRSGRWPSSSASPPASSPPTPRR